MRFGKSESRSTGGLDDWSYWRWAVCAGLVGSEDEAMGGIGAATPAVCDPRPSFCSVGASSLPLGFSPWPAWNFFMASTVESSHFPLGVPLNEPSFARACWISEIRSGAGAFCPGCRRLECLPDFFTRALVAAETRGLAAPRVGLLGADGADHAVAAANSSAKLSVIDVRSFI